MEVSLIADTKEALQKKWAKKTKDFIMLPKRAANREAIFRCGTLWEESGGLRKYGRKEFVYQGSLRYASGDQRG